MTDLFTNFSDLSLLALRLAIGAIFIVHGKAKLGSWKKDPNTPADSMTQIMRFLSIAEILGGLALILGLFTGIAGLGLAIIMLGAIYFKKSKWRVPFTTQSATGWEFDLVILAGCFVIIAMGAGTLSFDNLLL